MRPDPWKLAALVLLVFLVDELARPEVAHAPGLALDAAEALPSPEEQSVPPAFDDEARGDEGEAPAHEAVAEDE